MNRAESARIPLRLRAPATLTPLDAATVSERPYMITWCATMARGWMRWSCERCAASRRQGRIAGRLRFSRRSIRRRSSATASAFRIRLVLLLDVLRQALELLEKDQRAVRRDLEPLAARLARHVIVDRTRWSFTFSNIARSRASAPPGTCPFLVRRIHRMVVLIRAAAARALKARGTLLGLFRKELSFVHSI